LYPAPAAYRPLGNSIVTRPAELVEAGRLPGTPPNKWLTQQRLAVAAQLLRQGMLKASDVYDQAGYESMPSFIHSFKQVYRLTPKKTNATRLLASSKTT
jgi:AraC-like DNA-binding protein